MNYILVALGGAFGAMTRYAISSIEVKYSFPMLTLIINICACFMMGFFAGFITNRCGDSQSLKALLQIGFCGGFSTLAALSKETLDMFNEGHCFEGVFYSVGTVVVSVIAVLAGQWVASRIG